MKQLIVFFSSIVLGVFIYDLITGDDASSTVSLMGKIWEHDLELRSYTP